MHEVNLLHVGPKGTRFPCQPMPSSEMVIPFYRVWSLATLGLQCEGEG